jgi:hypothetical protein
MTRGTWQESAVVRIVQERVEVDGKRTQPRVYEMMDGCFLEVAWCGADRELLPLLPYGSTSIFKLDHRKGGRRTSRRRSAA